MDSEWELANAVIKCQQDNIQWQPMQQLNGVDCGCMYQFHRTDSMIKDYFLRLKDLRQDRLQFQTDKQKTTLSSQMNRQEDKYQAYIIDQMNDKNRIIATVRIVNLLLPPLTHRLSPFFKHCANTHLQPEGRKGDQPECSVKNANNDSMITEVEMLLLKYSVQSVVRVVQRVTEQQKKKVLSAISRQAKTSKNLHKLQRILTKFGVRLALTAIKGCEKQLQPKPSPVSNLFEDEFSAIYRQEGEKRQRGNPDESYLSFMFEKENLNSEHHGCQQCKLAGQKDKQVAKVRDEIAYLKGLLTEKNLEIMKKDELYRKLLKDNAEEAEQSANLSKNSSYYSELQKYVTGGKRIRKNGSRLSDTSTHPKEEISSQLLGKYMRESFQLKETIDVARELCVELRNSLSKNQRTQACQIIKVLSFGEEVSMVDQY